jgi:hypothetical protein
MSTSSPPDPPIGGDEPTTKEALPNVDLTPDSETEEIARETLGPDGAGEAARDKNEPVETDPDKRERFGDEEQLPRNRRDCSSGSRA